MPGRVERHDRMAERDALAVWDAADRRLRPQPPLEQANTRRGAQIRGTPRPRVVRVSVRHDRERHGAPRVHVEAAGFAEQA